MPRPRVAHPRTKMTNIRLTEKERLEFESAALESGCRNISEYVRFLHTSFEDRNGGQSTNNHVDPSSYPATMLREYHQTEFGQVLLGDSRSYLLNTALPKSVDLIMTSPPFGLVRKKTYGNKDANEYCDWFRPFAEGFRRVLKDSGSLVIDIGGAWVPGQPTRSLYHFKLLIMLVEEFGFHLCQEHYWWNPSKLPTPAEWVNVRRVRVKDAINTIWWLSKTPYPKASNRRVLQPYSDAMKRLLKGGYKAKLRPSGHDISKKFRRNNGGAVPPNLLAVANTESSGRYQAYCRAENIAIHPARFPAQIPEYFIRFLTDPGDLVADPFAGSCVTGAVAENLRRKWICCELSEEYLLGARSRFLPTVQPLPPEGRVAYSIASPCSQSIGEEQAPLAEDGGRQRPGALASAAPYKGAKDEESRTEGQTTLALDLQTSS